MKKVLIAFALVIAFMAAVVVINTVGFKPRQIAALPAERMDIDQTAAASHLAGAIRFPTISYQDPLKFDASQFTGFHEYLETTYPLVHAALKKEVINEFSLLYTWPGRDAKLAALVLMAHMDVVPVTSGTEGEWTHPAFEGKIADGFVWGRGALDDKVSLIGIMESVEYLQGRGFAPERTVYLCFGHDEEVGGEGGAAKIVSLLESRGVEAGAVLDESGAIVDGAVPGVSGPVALIGVAEKGYMSLELLVETEGGHSSMPPPHTSIGILARAITRLEDNPFPARLSGPTLRMFEYVGPEMGLGMRTLLANTWLFGPLIINQLEKSKATNAAIRTTMAATIISAGEKENVLPAKARAVVNLRLLPGDSSASASERVMEIIKDPAVKISVLGQKPNEATRVSDARSAAYQTLERTIRQRFPETVTAPYLVLGGTDAKHFGAICDNVFRFLPTRMNNDDLKRIHGTNERVSVENFGEIVGFYAQWIKNAAGEGSSEAL